MNIIVRSIEYVRYAPSAKLEVIFDSEAHRYNKHGDPNSYVISDGKGSTSKGNKWSAKNIAAYDESGVLVGILSVSTSAPVGAFKIVVRPDARRQGWGSKLLNKAEEIGLDMVSFAGIHNTYSNDGRLMLIEWLNRKTN